MTRLKVVAGYGALVIVGPFLFGYGVMRWVGRSLDKAVSEAFKEER